jgi:hypothetical protein
MAWTFHDGLATAFKTFSNNFPITLPVITIGDQLFLVYEAVGIGAEKAENTPAGWVQNAGPRGGFSTGVSSSVHILERIADGTEGATVTITTVAADNNAWIGQALSYSKVSGFILADNDNPANGVMPAEVIAATANILRICLWSFQSGPPATAAPEMTIRVFANNEADFGHSLCWTDEVLSGTAIPIRTPNNNAQTAWGILDIFAGVSAAPGFGYGNNSPFGP